MNNVSSFLSKLTSPWTHDTTPDGPSAQTVDPALRYQDACDRIEVPPVHPSVVAGLDWVGARLDQTRAAYSGPYNVAGTVVTAPSQFRMQGGVNNREAAASAAYVTQLGARVGLGARDVALLQMGRGDPKALVKLTQALIDDDQLDTKSGEPLPRQIQSMQWRFGIGVDCAGYVYNALKSIAGDPSRLGLHVIDYENFTELPSSPNFSAVAPANVRAGDVLVLKGQAPPGDPGHNLIVRSHVTPADPSSSVLSKWSFAPAFIERAAGRVDLFEVDASFGAGLDGKQGGVRRDVLLHDAASGAWMWCKDTPKPVSIEGPVPYGENGITGFFRAKVSP